MSDLNKLACKVFQRNILTDTDEELAESILDYVQVIEQRLENMEPRALDDLRAVSGYYRRKLAQIYKLSLADWRRPDTVLSQIAHISEEALRDMESMRVFYSLEDEDPDAFNIVDLQAEVERLRSGDSRNPNKEKKSDPDKQG